MRLSKNKLQRNRDYGRCPPFRISNRVNPLIRNTIVLFSTKAFLPVPYKEIIHSPYIASALKLFAALFLKAKIQKQFPLVLPMPPTANIRRIASSAAIHSNYRHNRLLYSSLYSRCSDNFNQSNDVAHRGG